jgi:hypothetical protein
MERNFKYEIDLKEDNSFDLKIKDKNVVDAFVAMTMCREFISNNCNTEITEAKSALKVIDSMTDFYHKDVVKELKSVN